MVVPLIKQCFRAGFSSSLVLDGKETDLRLVVNAGDFAPVYALAAGHAAPANGSLQIGLREKTLTSTTYDESGHSDIELVFLKGSARDFFRGMPDIVAQIRGIIIENFDNQTLFDLIEFGADFFVRTRNEFSYTLHAFGRPFFEGRLNGKTLKVAILDPVAYMKLGLFLLKGADALALSIRNPFDILALIDTAQASVRHLATTYSDNGITLDVSALGQTLFTSGYGVRPNMMTDRFGPTALHLDAIFKILSSALSGTQEEKAK